MKRILNIFILVCIVMTSFGQENLLSVFDSEDEALTYATFKATKIINLQSIEQPAEKELDFIISHRFGTLNSGIENLYGLDHGNIRMSFNYGLKDYITLGIARSSSQKVIDFSVKTKLINQGKNNFPLTISAYSSLFYDTLSPIFAEEDLSSNDFSYSHQILIARKMNSKLSIQISPTLTHYNYVSPFFDLNDNMIALGMGGRYKINNSVSINSEWIPIVSSGLDVIHPFKNKDYINSFSLGCDIETGGHVFQLFLSNSIAMFERGFINETMEQWGNGGVHFGFNISRVFNF